MLIFVNLRGLLVNIIKGFTFEAFFSQKIVKFALVGAFTVLIDAFIYFLLMGFLENTFVSKTVGFVCGAVFAYFANWRFTFGQRKGKYSEILFVAVYLCSLSVNSLLNELILLFGGREKFVLMVAFFVATGVSALLNFLGMSFFVFRDPKKIS